MAISRTAKIFLSYARADETQVADLYQKLKDAGFQPWMDKEDILPGETWQSSIEKAIRQSDFFLAFLSSKSVIKRGVLQREIKTALDVSEEMLDSDIYVIPVRLEEFDTTLIPERLSQFQWVDLFKSDGFEKLVKAISSGMERRELGSLKIEQSLAGGIYGKSQPSRNIANLGLEGVIERKRLIQRLLGGFQLKNIIISVIVVSIITMVFIQTPLFSKMQTLAGLAPIDTPLCADPRFAHISYPRNGDTISGEVQILGEVISILPQMPIFYSLFFREGIVRESMVFIAKDRVPMYSPITSIGEKTNYPIRSLHFEQANPRGYAVGIDYRGYWSTGAQSLDEWMNAPLGTWDVSKLTPGWYSLRLWLQRSDGTFLACDRYVYVKSQ